MKKTTDKNQKPKDAPVKTNGNGKKAPTAHTEKDADDLVHERNDMGPNVLSQDPDDLVHNRIEENEEKNYEERDFDDEVHRRGGRGK